MTKRNRQHLSVMNNELSASQLGAVTGGTLAAIAVKAAGGVICGGTGGVTSDGICLVTVSNGTQLYAPCGN